MEPFNAILCLWLLGASAPDAPDADPQHDQEISTRLEPNEPDPWIGDEEPLLAGPRLTQEAEERTLVRFEFNGNLRRLDRTPEEAALDALNLSAAARDRADDALKLRQTALEEFVRSDLGILLVLARARQAGTKAEAPALVADFTERVEAVNAPERLRDVLARSLPENERREFQRMIDEYWRALVLDEAQQAKLRRENLSLFQARLRIELNTTANELRRAFERRCRARDGTVDQLADRLELRADQESKVRTPLQELIEKSRSRPSPRELYDLTNRVLPQLDPYQRRVWSEVLLGVSPLELDPE